MVCLYCGTKLTVSNSRPQERTNTVWRRRACPNCQAIFTSVERIDPTDTLLFQTMSGTVEPFSRDVLFISIHDALKHRNTAVSDATHLTDTIIRQVLPDSRAATLLRADVVTKAAATIARFDKAAGVHYRAYHPL